MYEKRRNHTYVTNGRDMLLAENILKKNAKRGMLEIFQSVERERAVTFK